MGTTARTYGVSTPPRTTLAPHRNRTALTQSSRYDAVDALNSLQTPFTVIEANRKAGLPPRTDAVREMQTCLARIGHSVRRRPARCAVDRHSSSGSSG